MSHFSVLVAMAVDLDQEAVMGQLDMVLEQYDENRHTEIEWVDLDQEMLAKVATIAGRVDERADPSVVNEVAWNSGVRWYEDRWQYATRFNPQGKWDWWQWGGRWSGYIPVKIGAPSLFGERSWTNKNREFPVGRADACMVKDIDLEGERIQARLAAEAAYEAASRAVAGMTPCEPWRSRYERLKDDYEALQREREVYAAEPYHLALKNTNIFDFMTDPVQVMVSRPRVEDWVEHQMNLVMSTFAYVTIDGQWREQGEMGWFGFSHDNFTHEEWVKIQREWRDSLHQNTVVAVVDCHV